MSISLVHEFIMIVGYENMTPEVVIYLKLFDILVVTGNMKIKFSTKNCCKVLLTIELVMILKETYKI